MQGRPPEEEGTGGEVDTGLGPPLAKADAVATAAAGHPLGAAVAEATAAALLDQPAEVRLPGTVLHALSADHLQGKWMAHHVAAQPEASPDRLSVTDTGCSVLYVYVLCQRSSCSKLLSAVACIHQCICAAVTELLMLSFEPVCINQ